MKSKFMKLNGEHIRFVLDGLRENTTRVRYYTALVAHDMAQPDWGKPPSGGGAESL